MITRFAPSPTGPLHLGHAFSALSVWKTAEDLGGVALLRIEDTDSTRVRPAHEASIYHDLQWLGLSWPKPVRRQSAHVNDYDAVLKQLAARGLTYPCSCSRRDIIEAGAVAGVDGMIYPGTCQAHGFDTANAGDGVRLNLAKAVALIDTDLRYTELNSGAAQMITIPAERLISEFGDPILRRKDTNDPAYHLACVHDDALQGITHVVRGMDLRDLTPLHVLLQRILGYSTPVYHHHGLIKDADGKRLAKIDKSKSLAKFRAEGATPSDIKAMIGWQD